MINESEIRDRWFEHLQRRLTLDQFEDWLVQHSWNMHRDSDDAAQRLVHRIELRFAEYTAGHLAAEGLERELNGLLALRCETGVGATTTESVDFQVWAA